MIIIIIIQSRQVARNLDIIIFFIINIITSATPTIISINITTLIGIVIIVTIVITIIISSGKKKFGPV